MKRFVFLLIPILLFTVSPTQAQQSCVAEDMSTWTIAWGAAYSDGAISSNGTSYSINAYKTLTGVGSLRITITSEAPLYVGIVMWGNSDTYHNTTLDVGGGTIELSAVHPNDTFNMTVNFHNAGYDTSITSIEVCAPNDNAFTQTLTSNQVLTVATEANFGDVLNTGLLLMLAAVMVLDFIAFKVVRK